MLPADDSPAGATAALCSAFPAGASALEFVALLIADPGIDPGKRDVGEEIADQQESCGKQEKCPCQIHVLGGEGSEKERSRCRKSKHDTRHHHTREEAGQRYAEPAHQRIDGNAYAVFDDNRTFPETLGSPRLNDGLLGQPMGRTGSQTNRPTGSRIAESSGFGGKQCTFGHAAFASPFGIWARTRLAGPQATWGGVVA